MDSAVTGYFRLLLFFSSAVSRIAWSAERICNSESVKSRDLTFESRRIPYCVGAVAAGAVADWLVVARAPLMAAVPSLMATVRRPCRRCIPCVPVASAARGGPGGLLCFGLQRLQRRR